MFKHLLLPTDGSELSLAAIRQGVRFAKEAHARVTCVSVIPEFHVLTFNTTMIEDTKEVFLAESRAQAEATLALMKKSAGEEGVPCDVAVVVSDRPYEAIIRIAEDRGCDLILMASHGRHGAQALLLGSETHKVLTHSKLPVMSCR